MDAISDRVFTEPTAAEVVNDDPSLLTVILDISPTGWYSIKDQITIQEVAKSLLVFMNAHLSLNNSNLVAFITSSFDGSRFLYPDPNKNYDETSSLDIDTDNTPTLINKRMYRQFRVVDETVLQELNLVLRSCASTDTPKKSCLAGAVSLALTYTNRMLTVDQSISTTTASAINSTTKYAAVNNANSSSSSHSTTSITSMKSRILIVSPNDEEDIKYIPIMNSIFAAQKMKVPIDIAKLGTKDSSYLQQASDATSGIYLHIEDPRGLIQVLSTAYFIEPSIRPYIILPTNSNVNYRASCFITGKSVDLGYVCSVCLCIMSIIPKNRKCPACGSQFDERIIADLTRPPVVSSKKKRKLANGSSESTPKPSNGNANGSTPSKTNTPNQA